MKVKSYLLICYTFGFLFLTGETNRHHHHNSTRQTRRNNRHPFHMVPPKEKDFTIMNNEHIVSNYNFTSIGGYASVKRDLLQLKDMLLERFNYDKYNIRIPKGILLEGPPGNGKTLLAKSFAGECGFSFLTASGSEFNEKFVGVGAARCRDLFKKAQLLQPCILFIDEIDAIGSKRAPLEDGGSMEKSQTLNQLLVLMDGFDAEKMKKVIVIAATNRKEVLDPALLRSGRFDRIIHIGNPDEQTRHEIIKIHRKRKPISASLSTENIVEITENLSGADIENILNEVSLRAIMENRIVTEMGEFERVKEEILLGVSITKLQSSYSTLRRISIHEWGHVFASLLTGTHPLPSKVSIQTKSANALGLTSFSTKDSGLFTVTELEDRIQTLLGGYIAEKMLYANQISSGAHDDLQRVKNLLQQMVIKFGMGNKSVPTLFFSEEQKITLLTEYFERLYTDISIKMEPYIQEIELCALELLEAKVLYKESIITTIQKAFQKTGNDAELVVFKTNE